MTIHESKTLLEDDVSFKIVRVQRKTHLSLIAIDNGYVIDGAVGQHHYATPEALRAGLAKICDRLIEEVTKHRAEVQANENAAGVKKREAAAFEEELVALEEQSLLARMAVVRASLDAVTPKKVP